MMRLGSHRRGDGERGEVPPPARFGSDSTFPLPVPFASSHPAHDRSSGLDRRLKLRPRSADRLHFRPPEACSRELEIEVHARFVDPRGFARAMGGGVRGAGASRQRRRRLTTARPPSIAMPTAGPGTTGVEDEPATSIVALSLFTLISRLSPQIMLLSP